MRKAVYYVENEDSNKRFYYINLGALDHYRPIYKLWVPRKIVREDKDTGELYIQFPLRGVTIEKGMKNLVLKPGRFNLFYRYIWSGNRGTVDIEINDPEAILSYAFEKYESPRASLGISKEVFVLTPLNQLEIGWKRTGDVQEGAQKGVTRIYFSNSYDDKEMETVETKDVKIEVIEDIDLEDLKRLFSSLELNDKKRIRIYE